ncbi:hypothetical protein GKE82_25290 [Conexibacter sp. W3-3-2]|uniref:hypothetical protein n=1 Tax=Conexibacter sp. W3-3-2 TaxID=2675227 RepID=UPI0012B78011|nr:hypothetical protein [Conexibacter sp. W3-3-2]MTD47522.1 hypothetical protein [Conexibacter sp. W3-3-2]
MDDLTILDLHGDLEGTFVLEETRADGALVIRREPTLAQVETRHGLTPVPAAEQPAWFSELPTDDEG